MGRMYDDHDYQTTADDVRRHKQDVSGRSDPWVKDHIGMWRPKEGKNRVRILPPTWKDPTFFSYPVSLHYNVGAENGMVLCIAKMRGEQCAVCEEHLAIREDDEEAANKIRRADRSIAYVIDRKDEDEGPQVWLIGYKQDQDLVSIIQDEDTGKILMIANPNTGCDVIFTRTGTGPRNTQYSGFKLSSPCPLTDDENQGRKWLRRVTKEPLPDILEFKSEAEIKKLMSGKSKKDDDDEDEKPKSKKRKFVDDDDEDEKPAKKKKVVDEDEDDEDEKPGKASRKIASDDEDDEDEKPAKKKKPAVDEDEDEDEKPKRKTLKPSDDEDEDDEDEKPAKKKKVVDEDEESELPVKGKRKVVDEDEDDEDEKPAKKKKPAAADEDDEDEKPAKKKKVVDEDEDDEDEKPAKKKKKPADDDDD